MPHGQIKTLLKLTRPFLNIFRLICEKYEYAANFTNVNLTPDYVQVKAFVAKFLINVNYNIVSDVNYNIGLVFEVLPRKLKAVYYLVNVNTHVIPRHYVNGWGEYDI